MQEHILPYLRDSAFLNILFSHKFLHQNLDNYTKHFKKGTFIYLPEEEAEHLFFVLKGWVKIGQYTQSGRELVKDILSNEELFGELALIGETHRREFAFALEATTCYALPIHEIKALMRKDSQLSLFILQMLGKRSLDRERRLVDVALKSSKTRILEFILNFVRKEGERVGFEIVVRKTLTHMEIANLTGTSRQTVTTVLNHLRHKNLLTFNRKRLLIRDLDRLQQEIKAQVL